MQADHEDDESEGAVPFVLRGSEAGLDLLRACSMKTSDATVLATALEQHLKSSREERVLFGPIHVKASLQEQAGGEDDNPDSNSVKETRGRLVVTSARILFWSTDEKDESATGGDEDNLAVGAVSIDLHALTEADAPSVYLQLSDEHDSMFEWTVQPTQDDDVGGKDDDTCQALFDALSELVSLHPVDPNESDEANGSAFGMGMFGGGTPGEDFIIADPEVEEPPESTDVERQAMLDRLDDLLVVPPEFEQPIIMAVEGQFDDAEDEDDDLL